MNFETMNIWCWLIPALVGLICGILGYLLGKSGNTTIDNSAELNRLESQNLKLKADLEACNKRVVSPPAAKAPSANVGATAASFAAGAVTAKVFDASAAKAVFGKTIKQDDLKVVEGIGPKIEGMFKDNGIKTWKSLSEASVADCQKVLNTGGKRYQIHDPASWPMQAKMCYEGKWDDLLKWQQEHKHGKL